MGLLQILLQALVAKSNVTFSSKDPTRVLSLHTASFRDCGQGDSVVFKVPQDKNWVFVTRRFVDAVRGAKLTGALFGDPAEDGFALTVIGKSINVI